MTSNQLPVNPAIPIPAPQNEIQIRRVTTTSEKSAVFGFRYRVIVEEMGVMIPAANHDRRSVEETEDAHGHIFAAFRNGEVIGSGRVNFLRDGNVNPHSQLLDLDQPSTRDVTSVSSRFLVANPFRGTLVAVRLLKAWYQFLRDSGIESDYILVKCDLSDLYTRIGYRPCGDAVCHPEVGDVLPFRLSVFDEEHLRAVRSPFVHCLSQPRNNA